MKPDRAEWRWLKLAQIPVPSHSTDRSLDVVAELSFLGEIFENIFGEVHSFVFCCF